MTVFTTNSLDVNHVSMHVDYTNMHVSHVKAFAKEQNYWILW